MKSKEERRGSTGGKAKTLVVKERDPSKRPAIRTTKTTPAPSRASDESSYYGVTHQQTIASSRPRSHTRPLSYHGRPPLSGSAYYPHPPANPQAYPPPSYPPVPWVGPGMPMPLPMHPVQQLPPPSPIDYHRSSRDLSSRFERPSSSMGFRQDPLIYDHEPVPIFERTVARRPSVSRKASKDHDDRRRMPPPARPSSIGERRVSLRPPQARKSVGFEDDELDGDSDIYQPVSGRASIEYGAGALQTGSRRGSFSDDSYDDDDYTRYQREPPPVNRQVASYNYEDKINNASRYQNDLNGPGTPLTAETLKRVKNGGSRGSTRSSESRDESDYKHSATTRTTRSASAEDDITIKLPEGAVVEVNGARITCPGGGDVNIGRNNNTNTNNNNNNGMSRNGGSERATSVYEDDRKSRHERLPIRTRASSQAAYPRSASHAPPLYPHGYQQYPTYAPPSTYYDTDGSYNY